MGVGEYYVFEVLVDVFDVECLVVVELLFEVENDFFFVVDVEVVVLDFGFD